MICGTSCHLGGEPKRPYLLINVCILHYLDSFRLFYLDWKVYKDWKESKGSNKVFIQENLTIQMQQATD